MNSISCLVLKWQQTPASHSPLAGDNVWPEGGDGLELPRGNEIPKIKEVKIYYMFIVESLGNFKKPLKTK